jgi:sulfite exporter TauE/SafE
MASVALIPALLVGLFGSVHCGAMCGGIVAAFSTVPTASERIPIAVATQSQAGVSASIPRVLAYNSGRLTSYALAGALAAGLVGEAGKLAAIGSVQLAGSNWRGSSCGGACVPPCAG